MLLEVRNLTKTFASGGGWGTSPTLIHAVNHVSFSIPEGKTFGLVGESGSGKTTLLKMILGLERPTSGEILFEGADIVNVTRAGMLAYRKQTQAVFQDPQTSLNPRHKVSLIISEPLLVHQKLGKAQIRNRVEELLEIVGLPKTAADLYPHEFSGGQRQRIAIARALSINPRFLVLDEPISALDVSIRSQVLNLLADIQEELKLTYLIVAHDLALIEHFASAVGVMYLGEMVESGPTRQVFSTPRHPYTQGLLASVPRPDPDRPPQLDALSGEIPSPIKPPSGCKFHTRCKQAWDLCKQQAPARHAPTPDRIVTCHLNDPSLTRNATPSAEPAF